MSSLDGPAVKVAVWPAVSRLTNVTRPPARTCTVAGMYLNDLMATVAVLAARGGGRAAAAAASLSRRSRRAGAASGEGEGEA